MMRCLYRFFSGCGRDIRGVWRKLSAYLYLLQLFSLAFTGCGGAKERAMTIPELRNLDRQGIIRVATKHIREDYLSFDPYNFEHIRVMAGKETYQVTFQKAIVYLPMKSIYYTGVTISLMDGIALLESKSNPSEYYPDTDPEFYQSTDAHWKIIDFVLDAINRDAAIGSIPDKKLDPGNIMTISENADYYQVDVLSEGMESFYKVNKSTGKIYDSWHAHLEQIPMLDDGSQREVFQEVKD